MSKELQPGTTSRRGKRGNEVFSNHPSRTGIIIARALSDKEYKLTAERKPHAVAFGGLGRLCRPLIKAIRLGFPRNAEGEKWGNLFIRVNMKNGAAEGVQTNPDTPVSRDKKAPEEFHAIIHFDRLFVGHGILEEPKVTLSIDEETRVATFTQEAEIVEGAMNASNDRVYVVVYETVAQACIVRELRQRDENGSTSVALPERYALDNLAIYTFATTWKGDMASKSVCLQSPKTGKE